MGLYDSGTLSGRGSSENGTVPESVTVPDGGAVRYIGTIPDSGTSENGTFPGNGTSGQWEWDFLTVGLFLTEGLLKVGLFLRA